MWLTIYAIGFLIVLIWQYHDINKAEKDDCWIVWICAWIWPIALIVLIVWFPLFVIHKYILKKI